VFECLSQPFQPARLKELDQVAAGTRPTAIPIRVPIRPAFRPDPKPIHFRTHLSKILTIMRVESHGGDHS